MGIQPHAELFGQEDRGRDWDSADQDDDGASEDHGKTGGRQKPGVAKRVNRQSSKVHPEGRDGLEESQYTQVKVETREGGAKGLRGRNGDMDPGGVAGDLSSR